MEPQGEFGHQPENSVPQVDSLLPNKEPKHSSGLLFIIFAVVILLGIVGFVVFKSIEGNSAKEETSTTAEKEKPKDDSKDDDKQGDKDKDDGSDEKIKKDIQPVSLDGGVDDAKIQSIFEAVEEGINEAKIELGELKAYKDYPVPYSYKSGYATALDRSYGVEATFPQISDSYDSSKMAEDAKKIRAVFDSVMADAGFAVSDNLKGAVSNLGDFHAFLNNEGYFCVYQESSLYLACGNTAWLSQERKDLVTALTDSFYAVNPRGQTYNSLMVMFAKPSDIEESITEPYQTIETHDLMSDMWFYRKSPNDPWVFVDAGTAPSECADTFYATEDSRNAYKDKEVPCN